MAAEVVWVRTFTAWLGTVVYAFAAILALYLGATYLGSWIYRRWMAHAHLDSRVWSLLCFALLMPLLTADPRITMPALLRVSLGIVPFSAVLGFVTPCLLDRIAKGDPGAAGSAYSLNIIGCILGPLLAGFVLLPAAGERGSLLILAVPSLVAASLFAVFPLPHEKAAFGISGQLAAILAAALSLLLVLSTKDFAVQFSRCEVRRDYTATVIAVGTGNERRRLLVNGVGITSLTPITKMMVHLPTAFLPRRPQNGLVICFGMGTSHLSMLSWGVPSTAVELVPSVPGLVTFFHPNASTLMNSPLSQVVIDDGRAYLERSTESYDVITVDPPPPVEAAGSSLLASKEFYAAVRQHLRPGGILQQWFPGGEPATTASAARALAESFPYVRAFHSMEQYGIHFLASMTPISNLSATELAAKLPQAAVADLLEWGPASNAQQQFQLMLDRELSMADLIQAAPGVPALQDDRPVNEYFILRRLRDPAFRRELWREVSGRRETY
jgi:spermidine synthase